ncbi:MAG TPA: EamA family transporter [Ktedonobacteraceae bacterium]
MQPLGIGLGITIALLWGTADILATLAARRVGTFKATIISQSSGLLALFSFAIIIFEAWHVTFTLSIFAISALIGLFTGLCAALGYFAFYRSLEIGPMALVSPLSATSSAFTLLFAALILQEHLSFGRLGSAIMIIVGLVLASTSIAELRVLLQKPGYSLWNWGVRWALVATLAFGAMDFGIGASASICGWFLPVLWTRIFSIFFLTLTSLWKRRRQVVGQPATSRSSSREHTTSQSLANLATIARVGKPFSPVVAGLFLAVTAGIIENAAVLTFSFDTRIATTGITSAIASSYALVVMMFGIVVCHERLTKNQLMGIGVFTTGLILLAFL